MGRSFSIGDIVELNSGGPPMSVCEVNDASIKCIWFDDHNHVQARDFDPLLLRPALGFGFPSKHLERASKSRPDPDEDIPF